MTRLALTFVLLLLSAPITAWAQAATSAAIAGRITDPEGGVLPGVKVLIVGDRHKRDAVTDAQGRFEFSGLAPGTYRVDTVLNGFLPKSGAITLSTSMPRAYLAWSMEIGCLVEEVRVLFGPQEAAPLAEAIVHLRVRSDDGLVLRSFRPDCEGTPHRVYSAEVLNGSQPHTMELFLRRDAVRLQPGTQYLALVGPRSLAGDGLVFPIEAGRVVSTAPKPLAGMSVDDALAQLQAWAKVRRR